ncbi:MAG: hypothetical protein LBQ57_03050 [Spirochaetales bacterium]|jgi:4-hydroxy-4-methyl-2-oxoglutarate aldolase|nr:hypothetical protein [Spirochaetales bacterium]
MFDIVKNYEKVGADIIKKYSTLDESASINENLKVSGALNHDFRPVWPGTKIVGSAFTVRVRAGDNLILHKAITLLKPGDILVVTCDGFQESGGMWGGIMSTAAKTMGCPGMIIDGCVRDTMMMKEIDWYVWSRGISIKRSTKLTGGEINHPIVIGNVLVNPGDLVFADNDAVVIVPREQAAEVYERAVAREKREAELLEKVRKDGTQTFNGNSTFVEAYKRLGLHEEE